MTVKEIINDAMRLIGRADAAEKSAAGEEDGEVRRMQYTMLFCYNAVIDELARGYFPVKYGEQMVSTTGKYAFADFAYRPVKILRVTGGKGEIGWEIYPEYMAADCAAVTVEYEYVPDRQAEEDTFSYPDRGVGERLVSYGMAAEYQLICGEVESAEFWENKYRAEIDRALSRRTERRRVPPRRWL